VTSVVLIGPAPEQGIIDQLDDPETARSLASAGEVRVSRHPGGSDGFLAELAEADYLFLTGRMTPEMMRAARRLRLVAVHGTGYHSYLDAELAHQHGIAVANVPAYGDAAIAEHALALALALAKGIVPLDAAVKRGEWSMPQTVQLAGGVAGVVGLGGIGLQMVRLLEALGMEVLVWTRSADPARLAGTRAAYASLEEVFDRAGLVSLHLALGPATEGIIDASLLARARGGLILVNTARGGLIAPGALEPHLATGRIRAGLDVFPHEPPGPDEAGLVGAGDAVVLSPHVAFNTPQAGLALTRGAAANIAAYAAGEPTHLVTPPGR